MQFYDIIIEKAVDYHIAFGTLEEIEEHNILNATYFAMNRAINGLKKVDFALIDGNRIPTDIKVQCATVVKGDAKSASIAAASILAKVSRDRFITEMAQKYPFMYAAVGYHPEYVSTAEPDLNALEELLKKGEAVAVGEIGLDYYWAENPPKETQIAYFEAQMALARELSKYNLSVTVVDKNDDIGGDASKSNSGLFSTSATMPVGTLECQLRTIAHSMMMNICKDLDVPVIECGSIAPILYPDQLETAKGLTERAFLNGVYDYEILPAKDILDNIIQVSHEMDEYIS